MLLRRILVLACTLLLGCSPEEGDTFRPQPIPEQMRDLRLDVSKITAHREGGSLRVRGEAGASNADDVQLLVTDTRDDQAGILEVAVSPGGGFEVTLPSADPGAIELLLATAVEASASPALLLRVDADGRLAQAAAPCLRGAAGVWVVGSLGTEASLGGEYQMTNDCLEPVELTALTLRGGGDPGFTLTPPGLPITLAPQTGAPIRMTFALPVGAAPTRAHHAFVRLTASPDQGGGFLVRVAPAKNP